MNAKERAQVIVRQLGGAEFARDLSANSFNAMPWGLRFNTPRKVVDIQLKDDLYDVTVYKTGLQHVLGRAEGVYSANLRLVVEDLVSAEKGYNFQ